MTARRATRHPRWLRSTVLLVAVVAAVLTTLVQPDLAVAATTSIDVRVSAGRNHTSVGSLEPNSEASDDSSYGVLKMSLRPDSYEWEFIPVPGDTYTDSGSESCLQPPANP